MDEKFRVLHYLNQFFGGIGGEDKADCGPRVIEGPVGPGLRIRDLFHGESEIIATFICGDNHFSAQINDVKEQWRQAMEKFRPNLVIAGPCFDAGRYGLACSTVCAEASLMGIPAITGMFPENPGREGIKANPLVYIVPTANRAGRINETLERICRLGKNILIGKQLDSAEAEGYLSRGIRKNGIMEEPGAIRAVKMILKKMAGEDFKTEIPLPVYETLDSALPIQSLCEATLALVTEGGLVPAGNPDKLESARATKWLKYSIKGKHSLPKGDYYSLHGGIDVTKINEDPCRIVPLDAMRILEARGEFKKLYDFLYVTTGMAAPISSAARFGKEIGKELIREGIQGVILTAT